MKLPIIQSIIYGFLRPNQEQGLSHRDLAMKFSNTPDNLEALEKLFVTTLGKQIDFNFQDEKPVYIGAIAPDIYTHLNTDFINKTLPLPLSTPSNPKEKFYQNIVKAELKRAKATLLRDAEIYKSDISTRTEVKDLLKQVLRYAKDISSSNESIHIAMRTLLTCLYVDVCQMANDMLVANNDYLPFDELMYEINQAYPSEEETTIYQSYISSFTQTHVEKPVDSALPNSEEYDKMVVETTYDHFIKEVETYSFAELEKVKSLNKKQQSKLIHLIIENPVGYSVVMLKYIGYFDQLKRKYNLNKENSFKHVGRALQKSYRIIKGNYNILNPQSKENPAIYNSPSFSRQVEEDYKNLLL